MTSSENHKIVNELPWLGILILIILSLAFLLPVLPNDFWWYLRLGGDILREGKVPLSDTFSSTINGQSLTYPMWFAAVLMNGLYKLGDLSLIVFFRGFFITAFYVILWFICVRKGLSGWIATGLTLICALAGASNWAVRPQIFVYPFFGLTLLLFSIDSLNNKSEPSIGNDSKSNIRENLISNYFYLLIPITLLWANLHGSVIILFLLAAPYFLFYKRKKKFLLILILVFLSTFINPRGPMLWIDTFQIIQASGNQFSQEWKPPINSGWQMNLFFLWLLAFIPLATFSKNRLNVHEWIWLLGFGWMALSGVRYVIWFLAILLIFTGWLIQGLQKSKSMHIRFGLVKVNLILVLIMSLLPISLLPGIREKWWIGFPTLISTDTPVNATNWLKQNPDLPDPLFNDYVFGSYLIFALPERPVWIDTRFHNYPKEHWEEYLSISNTEPGWSEKLMDARIGSLFLDLKSQKNLIFELENSSIWCEVYRDDVAAIFSACNR